MKIFRIVILTMIGLVLALFLIPLAFTAITFTGRSGYYEDGRCLCGYPVFIQIKNDGYFRYSPGHANRDRLFSIRGNNDQWDALAEDGKTIGRLRFRNGRLSENFSGSNQWSDHRRVYNLWRVWAPAILTSEAKTDRYPQ